MTRLVLFLALFVAFAILIAAGTGRVKRLPAIVRAAIDVLFVVAAVRIGLGVAIVVGEGSGPYLAIPVAFGAAAWVLRPSKA